MLVPFKLGLRACRINRVKKLEKGPFSIVFTLSLQFDYWFLDFGGGTGIGVKTKHQGPQRQAEAEKEHILIFRKFINENTNNNRINTITLKFRQNLNSERSTIVL